MIEINNIKKEYYQGYGTEINNKKIEYIGEWRKDVAIGFWTHPINHHRVSLLINKNNEILYEGYSCYDFTEKIYRTSKGYYIVTGYRDCSAPGKAPDYRGPYIQRIIDEVGKTVMRKCGIEYDSLTDRWYDPNDMDFFIPREMGMGIVENEGSFYQLSDFKKIFEIPRKFKLESVFEQGLCLLSVPDDNRDFIVTVVGKEIVSFFDVNDSERLFALIDKTNDTSLIKFSKDNRSPSIAVFKKQLTLIEEKQKEQLNKVIRYSAYSYPRYYISEKNVTIEEFENGITITKNELMVLQDLHRIVCPIGKERDEERLSFHLRKCEKYPDNCLECIFYSDFMILWIEDGCGKRMYRFYTLAGESMSNSIFCNLMTTNYYTRVRVEKDKNLYNHQFVYSNDRKDCGIVIINDGLLIDSPFPDFMFDRERHFYNLCVHENFIKFEKEYYDFFYKKIPLKYTDVKLEEIIKKYLFKMSPDFELNMVVDEFHCGKIHKMLGEHEAKEKYMDGCIYLPFPSKLDSVQNELSYRCKNRPNYINRISYIGDYKDSEGENYSLYLFNCQPYGFCDTSGNIYYNFNPEKMVL